MEEPMSEEEAKRLLCKYLDFEATILAALRTLHTDIDRIVPERPDYQPDEHEDFPC